LDEVEAIRGFAAPRGLPGEERRLAAGDFRMGMADGAGKRASGSDVNIVIVWGPSAKLFSI
jgi:hypothetical protein